MRTVVRLLKEVYFMAEWLIRYFSNFKLNSDLPTIGNPVILFGNGPSLNRMHITKSDISDYAIMCVNFFALNQELFFDFQPKYYCIIDPAFFVDNKTDDVKKLERIFEKVHWDMTLVTLYNSKIAFTNDNIRIHRINSNVYRGSVTWFRNAIFKRNIGTYRYQNVLNAALYYLITCKCNEIYLVGADNDWHRELYVDESNEVIRETKHFYGRTRLNVTRNQEIKKGELYKYFYWYYITLHSHYIASKYALSQGVPVYNCNPDSYIDVFPKKKW